MYTVRRWFDMDPDTVQCNVEQDGIQTAAEYELRAMEESGDPGWIELAQSIGASAMVEELERFMWVLAATFGCAERKG